MMNQPIALSLSMAEQAEWGFRFRLEVWNESPVKILLPDPFIYDLRFVDITTRSQAEWFTRLLVSRSETGFRLEPGAVRSFDWKVRPICIESADESDFDYYRWSVGLLLTEYEVSYRWVVDEKFFDGDTHVRMRDLESAALQEQAVAWQGEAISNTVTVSYKGAKRLS